MTNKQRRFVKSITAIHALCEMIVIYYHLSVRGSSFRNPRIENKADKIKEFANSITDKELRGLIELKDQEGFEDEHVLELWRVMDHFILKPTAALREFADHLEEL